MALKEGEVRITVAVIDDKGFYFIPRVFARIMPEEGQSIHESKILNFRIGMDAAPRVDCITVGNVIRFGIRSLTITTIASADPESGSNYIVATAAVQDEGN